jgi:hypothetical protein
LIDAKKTDYISNRKYRLTRYSLPALQKRIDNFVHVTDPPPRKKSIGKLVTVFTMPTKINSLLSAEKCKNHSLLVSFRTENVTINALFVVTNYKSLNNLIPGNSGEIYFPLLFWLYCRLATEDDCSSCHV